MDKISSLEDLRASPIPGSVKKYLQKHLKHLTDAYCCSEISRFGCVYYLSQLQDINNYADMGLTRDLKETVCSHPLSPYCREWEIVPFK
jgi:hypothetical protein